VTIKNARHMTKTNKMKITRHRNIKRLATRTQPKTIGEPRWSRRV